MFTFWDPQLGLRSIQGRMEWLAHIWVRENEFFMLTVPF